MKKILLLTISILIVSAAFAKAGNPIPSFNVPISNSAVFQEDNGGLGTTNFQTDERRDMNVSNDSPGSKPAGNGSGVIQVIIYRVDQSIVLGPFTIKPGETLTIPIDGDAWGVAAQTDGTAFMSVWTGKKEL